MTEPKPGKATRRLHYGKQILTILCAWIIPTMIKVWGRCIQYAEPTKHFLSRFRGRERVDLAGSIGLHNERESFAFYWDSCHDDSPEIGKKIGFWAGKVTNIHCTSPFLAAQHPCIFILISIFQNKKLLTNVTNVYIVKKLYSPYSKTRIPSISSISSI